MGTKSMDIKIRVPGPSESSTHVNQGGTHKESSTVGKTKKCDVVFV